MAGRRRFLIYALLFLLQFINYVDRVTLSLGGKQIAVDLGLSPVQLGYLFSSFLWSYVICLLPAGVLTDRWGERRMAAAVTALWSVSQACTGLATGFGAAVLSRLGLGVGECATNSLLSRSVREWAPPRERGAAMAVVFSGSFFGPAFGAALVGLLIEALGWRPAFVISGAVGLAWAGVWLAFYRRPAEARWLGAAERAAILGGPEARNGGEHAAGATIPQLLRSPSMWGVALTQGCLGFNIYLFLSWLPNYLQTQKGLSLRGAGLGMAACYFVAACLSVAVNTLADRAMTEAGIAGGRRRNAVVVLMLLAAAMLAVLPMVENLALILVAIAACLTFTAGATAANFTLATDLTSARENVGKAIGILNLGANLLGMLGPIVTGYVVAWTGRFDRTFLIAAGLMLAGAAISFASTRRPIGASLAARTASARP